MSRVSKVKQIEIENETQALEFFTQILSGLPDPRRKQGVRYPFESIIVICLMATICGCDNAESMELWGDLNAVWLGTILPLPHGTPSQDVFLAVLGALDPVKFSDLLRTWADMLVTRFDLKTKHIAVDGKTSRRSLDAASGKAALHTVSAYLSDAGIVLGQCKTSEKSNEITAIPELLQQLDLTNSTVTIDAMGCQKNIAEIIVKGGGDYFLSVKQNQPTLYREIETTFKQAENDSIHGDPDVSSPCMFVEELGKARHGRLEKRIVEVSCDLTGMTTAASWPGLRCLIKITRERMVVTTQKTSREISYYIGSVLNVDASSIAHIIRRHWSIENELHWVLDMGFREDEARHRAKNTAQNMAILRHFAINIIKQDRHRKVGIAITRQRAGWDRNYLLSLLMNAQG
jgi:predicted transposase YbfD/YdcC